MEVQKENWISVRDAVRQHHVARRTVYTWIEGETLRSRKIGRALHVLEDDLLRVLAARAAGADAAQTGDKGANGNGTAAVARDPALADARRRVEERRLAAREALAETELIRNEQARVDAEAERQARGKQTENAAERERLALERERWQWEQERAAEERKVRHQEATLEQEFRHQERERQARELRGAWEAAWVAEVSRWAHDHLPDRAGLARAIALVVLLDFTPASDPDDVYDAILDALVARFRSDLARSRR
jgi:hypothetical protein